MIFWIRYEDNDGSKESDNEDDYLIFKTPFDREQLDNHCSILSQEMVIWKEILDVVLLEERLNNEFIFKFDYWVKSYLEEFNDRKLRLMSIVSQLNDYISEIGLLLTAPFNEVEMDEFRKKMVSCYVWLILINEKEEDLMLSKYHPSQPELNTRLQDVSSRINYLKQIVSVLKLGGRLPESESEY